MHRNAYIWLVVLTGLTSFAMTAYRPAARPFVPPVGINQSQPIPLYHRTLQFNVYTFTVESPDTGATRMVAISAYRGQLLLTKFQVRIDGVIQNVAVADLDANRLPEVYIFSRSSGSGSFGRVYGWQFLPERKADITAVNWQLPGVTGYMGHDSLWVSGQVLCRTFPRYQPGDANAQPTGGEQMIRYYLQPAGQGYALISVEKSGRR